MTKIRKKKEKQSEVVPGGFILYHFNRLASLIRMSTWVIAVMLIAVLIMLGFVLNAVAEEPVCEGEVTFSAISCFTDHRFFDDWKTVTNASITLDETKQFLNKHDLEVWSNGWRLISVPASTASIDVSGIEKPSFKLVDRRTLKRRTLTKNPCMLLVSCSFLPPPHDAVWAWDEDEGAFVLKVLGEPYCDDDKSLDDCLDMQWKSETVLLDE